MTATRIGDGGGSNFTFLIERGGERFVLRRPPRPPLPPSAHDMVREARLQQAIRAAGFTRLAEIVAVCDDDSVIGVPFYVMRHLDGHVITQELPPGLETASARHALGLDLVDTLVEIHAADVSTPALAAFQRPGSYLDRQVRRFTELWQINKTRELPHVDDGRAPPRRARARPARTHRRPRRLPPREHDGRPERPDPHRRRPRLGDGRDRRSRAPTSATSSPRTPSRAAGRARSVRRPSPPSRDSRRAPSSSRATSSGADEVEPLGWFEALALWKAAVFCEAIYGRYVRGELGAEDTRAAIFEHAVPLLAETALEAIS